MFKEWLREEDALKNLWNSPKVGIPLWVASATLTLYWRFFVPPPGYAIGALAVVAGIMSVREMKRTLAKVGWVTILICLLLTEFGAIDKDRADNDQRQKKFFEAQKDGFDGIANQAATNFKETTAGLTEAISGLNSNLQIATETLLQTQPHAELVGTQFLIPNGPVPPALFEEGKNYEFDFHYVNAGNRQGKFIKRLGRIYIGKPDDMNAQLEIKKQFEKAWSEQKAALTAATVLPQSPTEYWTEFRSFSHEEFLMLQRPDETVYAVSRMEYSDPTGKWFSDRCDCFQVAKDGRMYLQVLHPCFILVNSRYPARR